MNKRGMGLNSLYPAVLTIILVGIALGIGLYVLNQTSEAISTTTLQVDNETITGLATEGDLVDTSDDCGAHSWTLLYVTNVSNGAAVPATNYTFAGNIGIIYGTAGSYVGQDVNVSYTYLGTGDTSSTGACGVMDTTGTGVGGLASWIAVIVVIIAAAIVLGIVISSFGGRKSGV